MNTLTFCILFKAIPDYYVQLFVLVSVDSCQSLRVLLWLGSILFVLRNWWFVLFPLFVLRGRTPMSIMGIIVFSNVWRLKGQFIKLHRSRHCRRSTSHQMALVPFDCIKGECHLITQLIIHKSYSCIPMALCRLVQSIFSNMSKSYPNQEASGWKIVDTSVLQPPWHWVWLCGHRIFVWSMVLHTN